MAFLLDDFDAGEIDTSAAAGVFQNKLAGPV
jgi:hypothetical protein